MFLLWLRQLMSWIGAAEMTLLCWRAMPAPVPTPLSVSGTQARFVEGEHVTIRGSFNWQEWHGFEVWITSVPHGPSTGKYQVKLFGSRDHRRDIGGLSRISASKFWGCFFRLVLVFLCFLGGVLVLFSFFLFSRVSAIFFLFFFLGRVVSKTGNSRSGRHPIQPPSKAGVGFGL